MNAASTWIEYSGSCSELFHAPTSTSAGSLFRFNMAALYPLEQFRHAQLDVTSPQQNTVEAASISPLCVDQCWKCLSKSSPPSHIGNTAEDDAEQASIAGNIIVFKVEVMPKDLHGQHLEAAKSIRGSNSP